MIIINKIVYKVYVHKNGKRIGICTNFYNKLEALNHKIDMKNLGYSKVYIKKRNTL